MWPNILALETASNPGKGNNCWHVSQCQSVMFFYNQQIPGQHIQHHKTKNIPSEHTSQQSRTMEETRQFTFGQSPQTLFSAQRTKRPDTHCSSIHVLPASLLRRDRRGPSMRCPQAPIMGNQGGGREIHANKTKTRNRQLQRTNPNQRFTSA